jgi:hypothetical protein
MWTKKRTEITVETKRLMIARSQGRAVIRAWCEYCNANQHLLELEYIARVYGLSRRAIFRHIGKGRFHFIEKPDGCYVCLHSLSGE